MLAHSGSAQLCNVDAPCPQMLPCSAWLSTVQASCCECGVCMSCDPDVPACLLMPRLAYATFFSGSCVIASQLPDMGISMFCAWCRHIISAECTSCSWVPEEEATGLCRTQHWCYSALVLGQAIASGLQHHFKPCPGKHHLEFTSKHATKAQATVDAASLLLYLI